MKMFCVLITLVLTQVYKFVKSHQMAQKMGALMIFKLNLNNRIIWQI